jgi:nucleoside-diphosphate-sugar epimerase
LSSREHFTILGGAGFIGSELRSFISGQEATCRAPARAEVSRLEGNLGHVLYCAGTTSDFRRRPFDTIEAHVSLLNRILKDAEFDSLTYLSSTRVYFRSKDTAESGVVNVNPNNPDDLFNISKLAGESLCLNSGRKNVRAIRVSNVVGEDFSSGNFIFDLMREAHADGRISLRSSLASAKDYILITDAVATIIAISRSGSAQLYNLASGANITNKQIIEQICLEIPAELEVVIDAPTIRFRPIKIDRIVCEFGFEPKPVLPHVRRLAAKFREIGTIKHLP